MSQIERNLQTPLRERIGQIGNIIGAVGVVAGVVGFLWQGGTTPVVLAALFAAVAGLGVWIIATPEEARAILTGRQARFGTVTVFSLALLIGIVVMTYLLIQRQVLTVDMTQSNQFSLSKETKDILSRLDRNVQITGFYSSSEIQQRELDDQIYRLYEVTSDGRIKRVYIDPQEQPALAQSFGVQVDAQVFVSYVGDDGAVDFSSLLPVARESAQERDMTNALLRLVNAGEFVVAFNVGYTDFALNDPTQQGYTRAINALSSSGVTVGAIDLEEAVTEDQAIPTDIDALILLNINQDLPPLAIGAIDEYLRQGGRLMIFADVTDLPFLAEDSLFNQYLWENYGLGMLDAVVVDYVSHNNSEIELLSYAISDGSSITNRINQEGQDNTRVKFNIARAVEIDTSPPVQNGFVIAASPTSYGERNIARLLSANAFEPNEDEDIILPPEAGPLTTAAWANDTSTGAQVLLIGDSDFVRNGQIDAPEGNALLFLDSIAWLTGQDERLIFEPDARVTNIPLIFLSPETLDQINFVTLVFMPGAALVIGFFVWVRRSRL